MRRLFFELRYIFGNTPWDTGISPPELIAYLRDHPPGRALDLGCGTGTNSMTMAGFGWSVIGVDISALAIFLARRKARRSRAAVRFVRSDVTQMGAHEKPYEFVLDIGCYHALPEIKRAAYMQRLEQSTFPGSDYLLYTWLKTAPEDPDFAPTEPELRERITHMFDIVDLTYGKDHDRNSAWVHATRYR